MNLKVFLSISVVTILVAALFATSLFGDLELFSTSSEPFSELWLLGPDQTTSNYPFNITSNEMYTVYVGMTSHMGSSEDYRIYVKLRSYPQYLLEHNASGPSSSVSLYSYLFSVDDENTWQSPVNFGFRDVSIEGDFIVVGTVVVNDVTNPADLSMNWTSQPSYCQLFFELWRYDNDYAGYNYDNLSVGLWLNMTSS